MVCWWSARGFIPIESYFIDLIAFLISLTKKARRFPFFVFLKPKSFLISFIISSNKIKYESRFTAKGIVCDNTSLLNSWRCSKNVCQFITDNLGIRIGSNRSDEDNTTIEVVTDSVRIAEYTRNNSIVKLHYQNGSKKGYMHKNWGETKGEDKYTDVCVLLNKTTSKKMAAGKLAELAPMTKNKLYVAITRAKGNVYIFDE